MVRILIADDHLLLRQVVREIVTREPDLEIVAEASNGLEAITYAAEMQPDVVLLGLLMPACDGFRATEQILLCAPDSHVVIFSALHEEQHILRALQCGAIGYITRDCDAEGLLMALRRAARGELFIPPPLASPLLSLLRTLQPTIKEEGLLSRSRHNGAHKSHSLRVRAKKSKRDLPLTKREHEVLNLIRLGQRNREIARELRIAESTVHKHVQNIFEKLNARNRAEALFLIK